MQKSRVVATGVASIAVFAIVLFVAMGTVPSANESPARNDAGAEESDPIATQKQSSHARAEMPVEMATEVPRTPVTTTPLAAPLIRPMADVDQASEHVAGDRSTEETLATDTSVEGRPYPLSESVRQTCSPGADGVRQCSNLLDFLADFAKESRDTSWAAMIEAELADHVTREHQRAFKVRNVECRTARCVLEVEAPYQYLLGRFDSDPILKRELQEGIGDLGFESGAGNQQIIVTVATFERRVPSVTHED